MQLCLGAAGRELDATADSCALELGDAAERRECVDVRVYRAEAGAEPSLFGAARVALLALGLGDAPAAPAWRESWLALHRRQQCVGSIRLAACLVPRGAAAPEAPPTPHRSYEAMVAARQHAAWEAEQLAAREAANQARLPLELDDAPPRSADADSTFCLCGDAGDGERGAGDGGRPFPPRHESLEAMQSDDPLGALESPLLGAAAAAGNVDW